MHREFVRKHDARILIVECMQEISSFNPLPSGYENFHIERGEEIYAQRGLNTAIGGALAVFEARRDVDVVPAHRRARRAAPGCCRPRAGGSCRREILDAVAGQRSAASTASISRCTAPWAPTASSIRRAISSARRARIAGNDMPIVISLDLHGILTDRMLRQIDGLAIYHTYPHVDFADTGRRAARLLLRLHRRSCAKPVIARVVIPALVRGDELITKTGCYGDLIRECQRLERDGTALAAGIMIGNPFTDVPELCSQVLVMTDGDAATAEREAMRLARGVLAAALPHAGQADRARARHRAGAHRSTVR